MTVGPQSLFEFLSARRTTRRFLADPISDEQALALLQSAVLAPSAHNRQPWRFVVVRPGRWRERLIEAMESAHRSDLRSDGLPPEEIAATLRRSRERLQQAPLAVIVCLTLEDMDRYPDADRQAAEECMAVQSTSLAAGYLLLAAQAHGLGAGWMCAPLFARRQVQESLELPDEWIPQAAILLGAAQDSGRRRPRRPVDQVSLWR
jgi:coenzyme F420-0:L-glutamate ligase / coenzyme F420-1:gamma-L-glutamate ligase